METSSTNKVQNIEQNWKDLSDSQKIERIRSIIKQNNSVNITRLFRLEDTVRKLKALLSRHTHDENGKAVQPIKEYLDSQNGTPTSIGLSVGSNEQSNENNGEVYF